MPKKRKEPDPFEPEMGGRADSPLVVDFEIDKIVPHPENATIYGDTADQEFIDSVKRWGIIEPLIVSPIYDYSTPAGYHAEEFVVVSGHCRLAAAKAAGMRTVPAEIRGDLRDELDILEVLIESNRLTRKPTSEQLIREGKRYKKVLRDRAKQRQQEAANETNAKLGRTHTQRAGEASHHQEKGETNDQVGKAIGISGESFRLGEKVVDEIDRAEAEGDKERADQLRHVLENDGYKPAAEQVKKGQHPADAATPVDAKKEPTQECHAPNGKAVSSSKKRTLQAITLLDTVKTEALQLQATLKQIAGNRLCKKALRMATQGGCTSEYLSHFDEVLKDLAAACELGRGLLEFDL